MTKKLRGWVGVKDRRKTVALVTLTRSHAANHIILTLWYVPAAIGMVWFGTMPKSCHYQTLRLYSDIVNNSSTFFNDSLAGKHVRSLLQCPGRCANKILNTHATIISFPRPLLLTETMNFLSRPQFTSRHGRTWTWGIGHSRFRQSRMHAR